MTNRVSGSNRLTPGPLDTADQELNAPNAEGHAEHDHDHGAELRDHGSRSRERACGRDASRQQ